MPGRIRTTKQLARRIQKDYFKNTFPMPRWRRTLSWILAAVGLGYVGWYAVARDASIYSSGPVTKAHASFGTKCSSCHGEGTGGRVGTVPDERCVTCHDGPIHNVRQVSMPACASCHVEHRGREVLLPASNGTCTDCHSNLHVTGGAPTVAAAIHSFTEGHPEVSAQLPGAKDPGQIKFNHKVHLKKDLRSMKGNVQLQCSDCHRPAGIGAETVSARSDTLAAKVDGPRPSRAYMAPVTYAGQCSSCHPLEFDKRMPGSVPHQNPEVVHDFLVAKFEAYIKTHPEALHEPDPQRIPRQTLDPEPANALEWVTLRTAQSERLLWTKTCIECHKFAPAAPTDYLPRVVPTNFNTRWLKHASFDHSAHAAFECVSCHSGATASEKASDILIPGIDVCKECHNPSGGRSVSAGSSCLECHQYHDWTKEKAVAPVQRENKSE